MSELVLTEQDNGQSFDLTVGTPVSIALGENPGTGYRWNVEHLDEDVLNLGGSEFSQTPGTGIGGGGMRTFRVVPRSSGTTQLAFLHKRPWESDANAVGHFEVTLHIAP